MLSLRWCVRQTACGDLSLWYRQAGVVGVSIVVLQQLVCLAVVMIGYAIAVVLAGSALLSVVDVDVDVVGVADVAAATADAMT